MYKCGCFLLGLFVLAGCNLKDSDYPKTLTFEFDFNTEQHGWTAGFSDYPAGQESFYELASDWRSLPDPLTGKGLYTSGNNHSDDLFMFIKRKLSGLKPNTKYSFSFEAHIATNAASGCVGIGGSPGESVVLKAGASEAEPIATLSDGDYRMNIDKGNQDVGGQDAIALGDIANTSTDCLNPRYEIKKLNSGSISLESTTGSDGTIWAIFGTDSGFEGTTSLYYTRVKITALEH